MIENDPYASIRQYIKMPSTINVSDVTELFKPLKKLPDQLSQHHTQPILDTTNQLVRQLNSAFDVWEYPEDYQFMFPPSAFPEVPPGEQNMITYQQKLIVEQEDTFKPRLSEEQLKQIAETGQFKVRSNLEYITLPYVWKINQTIFWGKERITKLTRKTFAQIYGMFVQATDLLKNMIPQFVAQLGLIHKQLFMMILGRRKLTKVIRVNYEREVSKDFWAKIIGSHYTESEEWGSALWNYLHLAEDPQIHRPYPFFEGDVIRTENAKSKRQEIEDRIARQENKIEEKKNKIQKVHNSFYNEWAKLKKIVIKEITAEVETQALNQSTERRRMEGSEEEILVKQPNPAEEDQKVLDQLAERKFTLYVDHMQKQLPRNDVPLDVTNAIVTLLRLFRVIELRDSWRKRSEESRRKAIEEKIKEKHKIKSLYPPFLRKAISIQMQPIIKALDDQLYNGILNDPNFTGKLKDQQLAAYREFIKFRTNFKTLIEAKKKQIPERYAPSRTFYSDYPLLPPYQIIKNGKYYSVKRKSDQLTVSTAENFWKLRLYWMRIKTWTITCLVYLFRHVWKGPLGVRCFWGIQDFDEDMDVKYNTGEVYYHQRKTVLGTVRKVFEGIRKSRNHFEEQPDLGLLGKNVSRIFNYIECYVFRMIVVGFFFVLLGYPILILVSSVLTTLLVLTFWAWMPIVLLLTYLFNIMIYHFETTTTYRSWYMSWFPLFGFGLRIIGIVLAIVGLLLNLILVAPIRTLFIMIYIAVVLGFRKSLDGLMLLLFSKIGRTPSRDTNIAKKISGPGMSKEFYMSINQEDVYILVRARLQQLFMHQFNDLVRQNIRVPLDHYEPTINAIIGVFGHGGSKSEFVSKNVNALSNNYDKQYKQYMARFPRNPKKVRFTQQQIDNYFDNTVSIVRSFVDKNLISKWIFHDHQLYQDMYQDLARSIWGNIFGIGEQIFQPFQKLDGRFKLQDQYKNEDTIVSYSKRMKKQKVMRTLQGQVSLSHHRQTISPFKHNLLNRQQNIEQISTILGLWYVNRRIDVNIQVNNIKTLFVPHLGIENMIIIEKEEREREIQGRKDLVDL